MATETNRHKRTKWLTIGVIIVIAGGALVVAYRDRIERCGSLRGGCNSPRADEASATNAATTGNAANEPTTYTDEEFPFRLQYPGGWTASRNASGAGENRIVNLAFKDGSDGVSVVIVDKALEGVVRESLSVTNETTVTMNGLSAQRLRGASAKDGSSLDLLIFTKDGTLYVLNGPAALIERVGATVAFTR